MFHVYRVKFGGNIKGVNQAIFYDVCVSFSNAAGRIEDR
jgi:hypothetical protein